MRIGILTISDLGAVGQRADTSGDAILDWATERGYEVVVRSVVADETDRIAGKLRRWADSNQVDVVLTTGGRVSPSATSPRATAAILTRSGAGIAEALRAARPVSRAPGSAAEPAQDLIINLPDPHRKA
jgi:molybdopterin biosynthesis enzyme MoaB